METRTAPETGQLACAPSYAPISGLDKAGHEHVPPLDALLAEKSFHSLAEDSNGYYGTRPDPTQQPTVVGGFIQSREREELLRILELPASERRPEEVKLVVDLMARCIAYQSKWRLSSGFTVRAARTQLSMTVWTPYSCRTAFAEGLQVGLLAAVAPHVRLVWCAKGSTIIREGDAGDFMYIIVSGECQLEKADRTVPMAFKT